MFVKKNTPLKDSTTLISLLNYYAYRLKKSASPFLDSEIICAQVLGKSRAWLIANPQFKIKSKDLAKINSLFKKRKAGFPIAYLTKTKEFYGLEFFVSEAVLIPRPETEQLVELTLAEIKNIRGKEPISSQILVLDVGTGSGCIILSVFLNISKKEAPGITCCGSDISLKSLKVAKKNKEKQKIRNKNIFFKKSDLLASFPPTEFKKYANLIIVANLPYLSYPQYLKTEREIKKEPRKALLSLDTGFQHLRRLIDQLGKISEKNKTIRIKAFLEIDPTLKRRIASYLKQKYPKTRLFFQKDLQRKCRYLIIRF